MKENSRRFLKNAFVMVAASLLMRTVAVTVNAILSQKIGEEGMGLYLLVMSVYGFSVTFATSGVHLAVTRMVSASLACGKESEAKSCLRHAVLYSLFFGGVATAALLCFSPAIGTYLLRDVRTIAALRLLGVSMLPLSLSTVMNGYFIARKKASFNAAAQVFEQAVRIAFISFLLTLLLPKGLEFACIAMVGGGAAAEILSFLFSGALYLADSRHIKGGSGVFCFGTLRRLSGIALPVAFSAYIRSGLLTLEHALIPTCIERNGRTRTEALSDYGVLSGMALPIVLYPTAILYAVSGLLIPEFAERAARGEIKSIESLCRRALRLTSLFGFGCAMLFVTFSRELGILVYRSFTVGDYVWSLALVLPIMFADHITDCILKGLGEQVWTMWVNIIDSILSILLVMWLLPKMGAKGYVFVIILAEVLNFSLSFGRLLWKVKLRFSFSEMLFLPLLAAGCGTFLTMALLPMDAASCSLFWTVLRMVFCLCVYTAVCFSLSLFQECEEKPEHSGEKRREMPLQTRKRPNREEKTLKNSH